MRYSASFALWGIDEVIPNLAYPQYYISDMLLSYSVALALDTVLGSSMPGFQDVAHDRNVGALIIRIEFGGILCYT